MADPRWRSPHQGWLWILLAIWVGLSCAERPALEQSDEPRQPVEVQARVDRAVATTGDVITYRVEIDAEASWEIEIAEAGAEIAGFRIVDVGRDKPVTRGDRVRQEQWYQLRADLVGSYVLPPIEVRYRPRSAADSEPEPWQSMTTSEIFVEVESVLPADGAATDIRGLKPLREVRSATPWAAWVAGFLAIAVLAGFAWWYRRRRAERRARRPPIPPHELAFAALARLRGTDFNDPEAVRRFYFQLSEVVRVYVEGRFDLNATDLTTEEILADLVDLEQLPTAQNDNLQQFLVDTDQVKFAHREPAPDEIEAVYERALGFVEATRPESEASVEEVAA